MMSTGEGVVFLMSSGAKDNVILRIDPATNTVAARIWAPPGASALCAGEGAIWVSTSMPGGVSKLDPKTGIAIDTIETTAGESFLTTGAGSVWVMNDYSSVVSRIDPRPTR